MDEYSFLIDCKTEKKMIRLGAELSRVCRQGDIFALKGTLGMGKSVLARGFIQNLCGQTDVPSPTFTLVQMYESSNFDIYHFDLYRLKSPEEIFELGMEEAMYEGICLIEWPEKMGGYLPKKAIKINIIPHANGRQVEFCFYDTETYQRFLPVKEKI